ncbi:MAG: hypothetical protein R6U68_04415 [Desulfobacteraceae bacterium]
MKILNAEQAIIPPEKLRDYLLSPSHPVGKFKAVFFQIIGYNNKNWQELESALRSLLNKEASEGKYTEFGQKYEIKGNIIGPTGKSAEIVTVWIIRKGERFPRFITAYPGE